MTDETSNPILTENGQQLGEPEQEYLAAVDFNEAMRANNFSWLDKMEEEGKLSSHQRDIRDRKKAYLKGDDSHIDSLYR